MVGRPKGLADTDFPRPFRYGNKHDVHNTDAADKKTDGRNDSQKQGDGPRRFLSGLDDFCQIPNTKVIVFARTDLVALPQQRDYIGLDLFNRIFILALDRDISDISNAHQPLHSRSKGNKDHIILILPHRGLSFAV